MSRRPAARGFRPPWKAEPGTAVDHLPPARVEVLVEPDAVAIYLENGDEMARALGIPVVRTATLPRGTFLEDRTGLTLTPDGRSGNTGTLRRLIVGTAVEDPYEAVRRDARRIVYDGLARWLTPDLRAARRRQLEAEALLDKLIGAPEWPT